MVPAPVVPATVTLGGVIATELAGATWDLPTLAEAAHVTESQIRAFQADRLDLTDRRDIPALAAVIEALGLRAVLHHVRASLERASGGLRHAEGGPQALAARSRAHVSDEQRERDLYGDLSEVDESSPARARAIAHYLRDLETELEERGLT
jgi:hypothetical protein